MSKITHLTGINTTMKHVPAEYTWPSSLAFLGIVSVMVVKR